MKILHTAQSYPPEICGVQRLVQQVSEVLAARSHKVTVATTFHPKRVHHKVNGVCVEQFNIHGHSLKGWRGEVKEYIRFVKTFDADIVVNFYTRIWTTDLIYPLLSSLCPAKVLIAGGFSLLPNWKWLPYRWKMLSALSRYDRIVYHGKDNDYAFGKRHAVTSYSIIPNGAAEEEFQKPKNGFRVEYGINTSLMFLCVSNYGSGKNQEMVLKAFLQAKIPDSTLVFIGSELNDYAKKLEFFAKSECINARFLERVPRELLVAAYHEADLFLFGSQVECFPIVIVEAMASSTPFISTDVGCVAQLPGGVVVNSVAEMADAIQRLAEKGLEWQRLANAGRKAYEEKYRLGKIVDQYELLYLTLQSQKKVGIT